MPWLYSLVQTKSKVLRKLLQILQLTVHLPEKILNLRLEIILNAKSEQTWAPQNHSNCLIPCKTQPYQILQLWHQSVLHIRSQQNRVTIRQGLKVPKPKSVQVKQGRFQLIPDTANEQSWALIDHLPEVLFWDSELTGEKAENWVELRFDVGG
uniref:Uncharacterized protein n=1 Tax=Opuntia streptacantha TaxID=393608 RepID=A0A7C8YE72_OPUST